MIPSTPTGPQPLYSVPRRFGLGAMLIVTALFAGLFALLRRIGFDIYIVMGVTLYLLAIAFAQMCFPKRPRAASIVTGTVLFPLLAIPLCFLFEEWVGDYNYDQDYAIGVVVPAVTICIGPIFGYLSGAAGAGLFLLMDHYGSGRLGQHTPTTQNAETTPGTA